MLYTLKDARAFVGNFVTSGGACPNSKIVDARINEAIRRLLAKADWSSTTRYMRLRTNNNCVTLPRDCQSARLVNIESSPVKVFHRAYEFMESGPGDCPKSAKSWAFKDMGDGFPTFFDIPDTSEEAGGPFQLFAASTSLSDKGLEIKVFGTTEKCEDVLTNGLPGEFLPIAYWENGVEGKLCDYPSPVSETTFRNITSVHLPEGRKGYVSLYAVDTQTHQMYFLGKYHPDETIPCYRRYRIAGCLCEDGNCVVAMCKLRYLPASREDDVLLIQNLDAIKNMVISIREENARNLEASLSYEQRAVLLLDEQIRDVEQGAEQVLNVSSHFWGHNRHRIM